MTQDRHLIEGLIRRNSDSLAKTIEKYGGTVYALVARILSGPGRQEDIEECVSDIFLSVWQRIKEFHPERGAFRTWILMMAKYKGLDRRRQLSNENELVGEISQELPDPKSEAQYRDAETRQLLQEALTSLNDLERELIYRRYYLFESIEQLAKAYETTPAAIYTRLWRARRAIREKMSRWSG